MTAQPAISQRLWGLLLRLLVTTIIGLVSMLAAEAGLRAWYARPLTPRFFGDSPLLIGYGLERSASFTYLHAGRQVGVSTDANGRRTTPGSADDVGLPAVHLVGDSQVFGWGLQDEETIAAHLQKELGPDWRVINWGVPGYGPFAYVEIMDQIPAEDIVILLQTETNDLRDAYTPRAAAFARSGFLVPRGWLGETLPDSVLSSYTFVKFTEVSILLGDPRHPVPLGCNRLTRAAANVLKYRTDSLYEAHVAARGPRLLIATIPWDAHIDEQRLVNYRPSMESAVQWVGLQDDCDLADVFRGHTTPSKLFQSDYHISNAGAELIAETLLPRVLRIHNFASRPR